MRNQNAVAKGLHKRLDEGDLEMSEVKNEIHHLREELQRTKEEVHQQITGIREKTRLMERNILPIGQQDTRMRSETEGGSLDEELTEGKIIETNVKRAREIEEEQKREQIQRFQKVPRAIREENRKRAMDKVQTEMGKWNNEITENRKQLIQQLQEFRDVTTREAEEEERRGGFVNRPFVPQMRSTPVPLIPELTQKAV